MDKASGNIEKGFDSEPYKILSMKNYVVKDRKVSRYITDDAEVSSDEQHPDEENSDNEDSDEENYSEE